MGKKITGRPLLIVFIAFVAAAALVYKVRPDLLRPKTRGSFEYIRKGEALMDKGEYARAIPFFEKAAGSSPDSGDIKSYLAYACTRYGLELANEGDYDGAIRYLTDAYETTRDNRTSRNLALLYAKKAVALAGQGDWPGALECFRWARTVTDGSVHASKALARFLVNEGIGQFHLGNDKAATVCLHESLLIDETAAACAALAQAYYKRTDLEQARFYWAKALRLDPEDSETAGRIERVTKEIALAKTEERRDLPHFELRYERSLPFDEATVQRILEEAYRTVGDDLGYYPAPKTRVFLYSEKGFREVFKASPIVRGFYDGNIRIPLPEKGLEEKELAAYLRHEYAHAIVSAVTHNRCPVWFSEGIAVREQGGAEEAARALTIEGVDKDKGITFASLEAAFTAGEVRPDIGAYYLLAYTAVEFIVDGWGIESLRRILKRMGDRQHLFNAIDDELLLSEDEFQARWNRSLAPHLKT